LIYTRCFRNTARA